MINNDFLKNAKNIHFIGIGGIGVSAIARMMLMQGKNISGSDVSDSFIIRELKESSAKIYIGHTVRSLVSDTDLVVHTTAILDSNPELKQAKKLKIPVLTYPEMLGLVSNDRYTIAVSGTHGKTTTTAMLAKILIDANLDPNVIVGSLLKQQRSNFIAGKGKYFICEACEYKRAFLNLTPKIIVITNIDNDHLDYYKNLKGVQKAFTEFISKLNRDDFLVCNTKDKNLKLVIKKAKSKIIDYSKIRADFRLKIPGKHNIENAQASLATAKILGINFSTALRALNKFTGTWRRFEYKGRTKNGILIYDDYAHHPTEIRATLSAVREKFKNKKVFCVFQPHLFSRTRLLLNDFAKSFKNADMVIITDIYAAREKNDKKIHSKDLVKKINPVRNKISNGIKHPDVCYIKSFSQIEKFLKKNTKKGDVIITMGAGDIFKMGENLIEYK